MRQNKVSVIGVTGSIACGKSTVTEFLKANDYSVVDCDIVAKEVTNLPNVVAEIKNTFGSFVIKSDGSLDRAKLGELVFNNKDKKDLLDNLLKNYLLKAILENLELAKTRSLKNLVFLDCPLLFESGINKYCDKTVSIFTDQDIQLQRLMKRNQVSQEYAQSMIDSQFSSQQKANLADYVIENNGDIADLHSGILDLLSQL